MADMVQTFREATRARRRAWRAGDYVEWRPRPGGLFLEWRGEGELYLPRRDDFVADDWEIA